MSIKKFLLAMIAILFFFFPLSGIAMEAVTIDGTFQGANCLFHNKHCPMDMSAAHIAIEPDFLLVDGAGEIFYVPNLDRGIKVKYIHKPVRIKGFKSKHSVQVKSLFVKENGKFKQIWSYEEEQKERERLERK